MSALRSLLADRVRASMVAAALLVVGGLAILVATWAGMRGTGIVAGQLPYVVSGGLTAVALVVFGVGAGLLQAARRANARTRAEMTAFADTLEELVTYLQKPGTSR